MKDNACIYLIDPSQFLIDHLDILPRGNALDIAMGSGRNSIYLAEKGYSVDGVDASADAVEMALQIAREKGLTINPVVADLEQDYYIASEYYDLIICFNYLQRTLIPAIKNGLRKGGIIVFETYTTDQAQFGHPSNPDYLLKHNELLDMFRDFRCLRYHEGIFPENKALAGIIAERIC